MYKRGYTRRDFIKGASALMLPSFVSGPLLAQTVVQRPDWNTFSTTRDYGVLIKTIQKMKSIHSTSDRRSWDYWVNVHVTNCPHGIAYFLGWHRGYLYYLEQQLRAISGSKTLVIPYWDYYSNPEMPADFTNPSPLNPLYVQRVNTNVIEALTLTPFGSTMTNMQRGLANAFETSVENMPHNPVHNIIGNIMADMQSPVDPIFFMHHANIDRLWSAWQQGGGGRTTPPANNNYWNGSYTYAPSLTMPRNRTIDTRSSLTYNYRNETMPTSLPVASGAADGGFQLAAFQGADQLAQLAPRTGSALPRLLSRPALQSFAATTGRQVSANRLSLAGVLRIPLDESSVSTQLAIDDASANLLTQVLTRTTTPAMARFRSAQLVLDNVTISDPGRTGGYFYYLYLNLPSSTDVASASNAYLLGSIGPFEIAGAQHRVHMNIEPGGSQAGTVRLAFPLTSDLSDLIVQDPRRVTVSFVRVSGGTSPGGAVIQIGEARLELTPDPPM